MPEHAPPPADSLAGEGREGGRQRIAMLQVLGTTFLWGTIPVAVKVALPSFDPYAIACLRYAFGARAIFLWLRTQRGTWLPMQAPVGLLLLGGVASASNYVLYNMGIARTTASAASFIIQGETVALLLLASVFLRERWTPLKAWGSLVCTAGVLIVGWNGSSLAELFNSSMLLGNVMVFFAGVSWAVYALCQKLVLKYIEPIPSLLIFFLIATFLTGFVWVFSGEPPRNLNVTTVGGMVYMGVLGTGLSYLLMTAALKHMDAGTAGMWTTPMPLVTALLAFLILREWPTAYTWVGGSLVLLGLLLLSREEEPV